MFKFDSLIGLKQEEAAKILSENGYNNIEILINSKSNEKTDSKLVLKAEQIDDKILLIVGEFYLNIKG